MATYLARDALRLPAASLLANSGLCINIEIKIWLLLGVNVDTTINICHGLDRWIHENGNGNELTETAGNGSSQPHTA